MKFGCVTIEIILLKTSHRLKVFPEVNYKVLKNVIIKTGRIIPGGPEDSLC